MGASIVDIRPGGRFDLFNKSNLYDMYVNIEETEQVRVRTRGQSCHACEKRVCPVAGDIEGTCLIKLIDVDVAGNCVFLGVVDSTTVIPGDGPGDDSPIPEDEGEERAHRQGQHEHGQESERKDAQQHNDPDLQRDDDEGEVD